jgi:hypothetical protein
LKMMDLPRAGKLKIMRRKKAKNNSVRFIAGGQ